MTAYLDALKMLGRRELSERQVRQRLARRAYSDDETDAAIARLKQERALDDARVAAAIARAQVSLKGRGRVRVRQEIQAAGIASHLADDAVAQVFSDIDDDARLVAAIERRLKPGVDLEDERQFHRVYRHFVGKGFESERVLNVLKRKRRSRRD